MSGGIFTTRPFHVNPKCVWFAIIVMLAYWYLVPNPNTWLLPILASVAYVSMAWYDFLYNCKDQLYPGSFLEYTAIFKPEATTRAKEKGKLNSGSALRADQSAAYMESVYFFHALFIAPLLIYAGYKGNEADPRTFGVLLGSGVIALLYHGFRMIQPRL